LQAGGDASEVVLVALTERGKTALLATSAKLGADVGIAVGPVGAGAEAATANLSADIISFSRAKGLYAGVSLEGAVVATRGSLNKAYYGKEVSPTDILVKRTVSNKKAAGLVSAVKKAAGSDLATDRDMVPPPRRHPGRQGEPNRETTGSGSGEIGTRSPDPYSCRSLALRIASWVRNQRPPSRRRHALQRGQFRQGTNLRAWIGAMARRAQR